MQPRWGLWPLPAHGRASLVARHVGAESVRMALWAAPLQRRKGEVLGLTTNIAARIRAVRRLATASRPARPTPGPTRIVARGILSGRPGVRASPGNGRRTLAIVPMNRQAKPMSQAGWACVLASDDVCVITGKRSAPRRHEHAASGTARARASEGTMIPTRNWAYVELHRHPISTVPSAFFGTSAGLEPAARSRRRIPLPLLRIPTRRAASRRPPGLQARRLDAGGRQSVRCAAQALADNGVAHEIHCHRVPGRRFAR